MAVIGAGISGLAAAHRLIELCPAISLSVFEASDRVGGVIATESRDGYLLERSADSFITNVPWASSLCERVGLADSLIETEASRRRAFIVRRNELLPTPAGFSLLAPARLWPVLTTRILSPWGKLRLFGEVFVPRRRAPGDESLAAFARRRLGREAYERLVQPLVAGVYSADGETLSLAATMPRFVAMEREHGGLIRGMRRDQKTRDADQAASGARYGMFLAPRAGMEALPKAIAQRLPPGAIRLRCAVSTLTPTADGKWDLEFATGDRSIGWDGVVIAVPAPVASRLIAPWDGALGNDLAMIEYAGCLVAAVGFRREQIDHPLDGFGFVVPASEGRAILAASFSSQKFPGRSATDRVLIRVFLGGATRPDLADLDDSTIRKLAIADLAELLGVRGEPELFEIYRWTRHMPQYKLGHLDRVARLDDKVRDRIGLALAGCAYRGVGAPHCVRDGERAAAKVLTDFAQQKGRESR